MKIFAPTSELPFAGHPNLGTAFVLHQNDYLGNQNLPSRVIFEETAGLIPMTIEAEEGETLLEPEAPASLTVVQSFEIVQVSKALNLPEEAISTHNHLSQLAFVGLPLLMVELNSIEFLKRASPNMVGFQSIHTRGVSMIHLYTHTQDEFDIRTRMFAPFEGVVEDPATGSANCALARFPAYLDEGKDGNFSWKIAQGV